MSDLLGDVHTFLGRFIVYPSEHAQVAHTLWVAHTHLMDVWDSTPRIAFLSPEPNSGKTRALEVSEMLVSNPIASINASPSFLFRRIADHDAGLPTVLFDEVDTLFGAKAKEHEEVRGVLNGGHRRGATAGRAVIRGKEVGYEQLPSYCAVALAGLGFLPDTITSRAVVVRMRRRSPSERVEPFRPRLCEGEGHALRDRLAAWAAEVRPGLGEVWPEMPAGIEDRNADVWEALLSVADAAGGDWSERARVAAVALVAESGETSPSLGVRLLADLRQVFGVRAVMSTEQILTALLDLEEAPWGELKGKPLDARGLARRLNPYGVHSKTVRIGTSTPKGYDQDDFYDAWARYLPTRADADVASKEGALGKTVIQSTLDVETIGHGAPKSATSAAADTDSGIGDAFDLTPTQAEDQDDLREQIRELAEAIRAEVRSIGWGRVRVGAAGYGGDEQSWNEFIDAWMVRGGAREMADFDAIAEALGLVDAGAPA